MASLNSALIDLGVFGDDVYTSTDLNRRSAEVLNKARKRPVTISRNNEQFAILRREQAAHLVQTVNRISGAMALLSEVNTALSGGKLSDEFAWLQVYAQDDLKKLFSEVLAAARRSSAGQADWSEVAAVIHEWYESALVARSSVLDDALHDEPKEMRLPAPEEVLSSSEDELKAE